MNQFLTQNPKFLWLRRVRSGNSLKWNRKRNKKSKLSNKSMKCRKLLKCKRTSIGWMNIARRNFWSRSTRREMQHYRINKTVKILLVRASELWSIKVKLAEENITFMIESKLKRMKSTIPNKKMNLADSLLNFTKSTIDF